MGVDDARLTDRKREYLLSSREADVNLTMNDAIPA